MDYKNLKNKLESGEILTAEDEKIRFLLGNLKRVEAPKNFDFGVKARIAKADSRRYHPRQQFLPVLRYVLPLALVLLISAAIVFNSVYFSDSETAVPQIAETRLQPPVKDANLSIESISSQREKSAEVSSDSDSGNSATLVPNPNLSSSNKVKSIKTPYENIRLTAEKSFKNQKAKVLRNESDDLSGSHTSAFSSAKIIAPPGFDLNQTPKILPNPSGVKFLMTKDVLFQLGIDASFADEKWKVKSVRQNSLAERSGVKTNDVIEAIDGEKVNDKPLQNKKIEGGKLTIARGAEKIEIILGSQ